MSTPVPALARPPGSDARVMERSWSIDTDPGETLRNPVQSSAERQAAWKETLISVEAAEAPQATPTRREAWCMVSRLWVTQRIW